MYKCWQKVLFVNDTSTLLDVKMTVLDAFMTTYYFLKMYKGRRNVLFVNNTSTVNLLVVKMAASL